RERPRKDLARDLRMQLIDRRSMAIAEVLAAATRARPMPLDPVLRQIAEESADLPGSVKSDRFLVEFEHSRSTMRTLSEWPALPPLDEAVPNQEGAHRPL